MSEDPAGKPRPSLLRWALWGGVLIGVAGAVYIMVQSTTNPAPKVSTGPAPAAAPSPLGKKVSRPEAPSPPPDYAFFDDYDGEMACDCGTASCRRVVHGRDWRRPELQARYGPYFSWYLRRRFEAGGSA